MNAIQCNWIVTLLIQHIFLPLQKTSEWIPMSASRSQILQYISSLLLLKQPSTDIKDGDNLQPWLEDSPSDTNPIRFPANRNRQMRVVKRQRPCFWSVVTCYWLHDWCLLDHWQTGVRQSTACQCRNVMFDWNSWFLMSVSFHRNTSIVVSRTSFVLLY